jgi:SH3 domain protein
MSQFFTPASILFKEEPSNSIGLFPETIMKSTYILKFFSLISLFFFFCLIPANSHAETKFISGLLVISIRDSIEKSAKNIGTVKTGDQVEILEEKDRFSRIRTKDNIEGWLPTQFLQTETPKIENISRLKDEIASLRQRNEQLSSQAISPSEGTIIKDDQKKVLALSIDSLKGENKRLQEEKQKLLALIQEHERSVQTLTSEKGEAGVLKEKVASLQEKLDVLTSNSKDIINITKERDSLASEIEPLRTELARTKELNQTHEAENMLYWFFAGAAVFFIGLLSSKIFTRKKNKLSF